MFLHRTRHFIKHISTSTTKTTTRASVNWRTQIEQSRLVQKISLILLQRHNWASLLNSLYLSSKLTPSLFLQILHKTQHNPQISLDFFNWTATHLRFKPDLKSQCHVIQLAVSSGQTQFVKPILDSLVQTHSSTVLTSSMIQACKGRDFQIQSVTSSFVLDFYSRKGLILDGLEVYKLIRVSGFVPSISACNVLLDVMCRENEIRLAWCLCGSMFRYGVFPDKFTWSYVSQILCKNGKFEAVLRLLDSGIYNSIMYNLVIDWYSKIGDFEAAFDRLNEMCDGRKLNAGFSTYSSILDGACKYENVEVSDRIMDIMVKKGLLPNCSVSENDTMIQKLCDFGKTYAAEMIFKRTCDRKIRLQDDTYGGMLRALSKEGRAKEAIDIYRIIFDRGVSVKGSSYYAFANVICKQDQSEEACEMLRDIVKRGYCPCATELSKFVAWQCSKHNWGEVEKLLNAVLEQELLLDSFCCSSLMEHYCSCGKIDKAIVLHNKMEKLKGSLDVETYNVLLVGLFKDERIEEAVRVFDYMKGLDLVSSKSFTIMISGLCRVKELRKAMKIHDEMLKMKHKPDDATYKRLISGFR
ncbi:hypothetical protein LWI29_000929 [Acer saccharum]|uniref:Pentatricopeptide repeat-containing protein n=1 Tax=Acer saccharum TaxID=4024 RepID=A0AA39RQ92_ACESA|nr:hypothetical protein LWI29_000929 [Acer saccharum]